MDPRYSQRAEETYTATQMAYTGGGGQLYVSANTTIGQTGANLEFSSLKVTAPMSLSFGLGPATLNQNTFDGTNQYSSSGCGIVTSHYKGYFSGDGNIMNMQITLSSSCGNTDIRGEMRRQQVGSGARPRLSPGAPRLGGAGGGPVVVH